MNTNDLWKPVAMDRSGLVAREVVSLFHEIQPMAMDMRKSFLLFGRMHLGGFEEDLLNSVASWVGGHLEPRHS